MQQYFWNYLKVTQDHAEKLLESELNISPQEAYTLACKDESVIKTAWENFIKSLNIHLQLIGKNGNWKIEVRNFGWKGINDYVEISSENIDNIFSHFGITDQDMLSVYVDKDNVSEFMKINRTTHLAPNEWYCIRNLLSQEEKEQVKLVAQVKINKLNKIRKATSRYNN
jgi:hypothetical protein